MFAPITALYAGLLGLMVLVLAGLVVRARWRYKTGLGTGSEPGMERAVRVHANFVEYVPLTLVVMLAGEINGLPSALLHGAGIALVAARALHAWGLGHSSGRSFGRFWGTATTWLVLLVLSLAVLVRAIA